MAVLLLIGWEIGKWVVRRRGGTEAVTVPPRRVSEYAPPTNSRPVSRPGG